MGISDRGPETGDDVFQMRAGAGRRCAIRSAKMSEAFFALCTVRKITAFYFRTPDGISPALNGKGITMNFSKFYENEKKTLRLIFIAALCIIAAGGFKAGAS